MLHWLPQPVSGSTLPCALPAAEATAAPMLLTPELPPPPAWTAAAELHWTEGALSAW